MKPDDRTIDFGPFRLDLAQGQLWRAKQPVRLRRKAWEMLRYLAERPGVLIGSDLLLDVLWPGVAVTPKVLTNVIGELRRALHDDAGAPQVIETVHRRGYRFIAPVAAREDGAAERVSGSSSTLVDPTTHGAFTAPPAIFVGRDGEIETLSTAWQSALRGHRQVVFVAGEAGIGKTGLLDTLVDRLYAAQRALPFLSGRGQSVEKFGEHEPFRPVLEIFNQLASGAEHATELLRRYAPSWLVQIPWLVPAHEIQALRQALAGIGSARMLREGSTFLEALSQAVPLLLVLEDVHWSDPSTIDFLSSMAQRTTPARMLMIATYRPAEASAQQHSMLSVARALQHRHQARILTLGPLTQSAVETFLAERFDSPRLASKLGPLIERHTAGHPLLLVATTEQLVQQGWMTMRDGEWRLTADLETLDLGLPDQLREIVEAQTSALPQEQLDILEAASVAGLEFSTQVVAAAVGLDPEAVERTCEQMARRGRFLRLAGTSAWPDGSVGEVYAFHHALYQRALYEAVAPLRRRRVHQRIAERLERGYGERASEIASELAAAYMAARQPEAAARVLELAAVSAVRRFAYREAAEVLGEAIGQLREGPAGRARDEHERRLQLQLGNALMAATSLGDRRAREAFLRAEALCEGVDASRELFRARLGQCMGQLMAGDIAEARTLGERLLEMNASLPRAAAAAHTYMAAALMLGGEFVPARQHLERAMASAHEPGIFAFVDLKLLATNLLGLTLTRLGFFDEARSSAARAVARSRDVGNPYDRAQTLCFATEVYLLLRDWSAAEGAADEAAALASENGFQSFLAVSRIYQCALRDGLPEDIQRLIEERWSFGERWNDSRFLAIVAEQHLRRGAFDAAARRLDDALSRVAAGERYHEAELYRLKGELHIARAGASRGRTTRKPPKRGGAVPSTDDGGAAEACLRRGIDVARAQEARLFELRGAVSLGRLLGRRGQARAARQMLGDTLCWFPADAHAPDIVEARTLFEELAR